MGQSYTQSYRVPTSVACGHLAGETLTQTKYPLNKRLPPGLGGGGGGACPGWPTWFREACLLVGPGHGMGSGGFRGNEAQAWLKPADVLPSCTRRTRGAGAVLSSIQLIPGANNQSQARDTVKYRADVGPVPIALTI